MTQRCHYDVLGLEKDADSNAIKSAFRKKMKETHPDRNKDNPNAEAEFKAVNDAKIVLTDAKKKSVYDEHGFEGLERLDNGENPAGGGQTSSREPASFDTAFKRQFEGAGSDPAARPKRRSRFKRSALSGGTKCAI